MLDLNEAGYTIAINLALDLAVAHVSDGSFQPIGSLKPLPTPTPKPTPPPTPKPPTVTTIAASFFGSGVKIATYRVTGATPNDIVKSINANGPYSKWLGGRATGLTTVTSTYRFVYSDNGYGGCQIVTTATPAIVLGYKVILPRWSPPSGVSAATILWWNGEVTGIATHEKVHVDTGRATAKRLNTALAASTCANADRNLQVVWDEETRQDCEFDMKEYGSAAGLSLKACLNQ